MSDPNPRLGLSSYFSQKSLSRSKFRSDSEKIDQYLNAVDLAVRNDRRFKRFKRDKSYQIVLEHVTEQLGSKYLEVILSREDGFFENGIESINQQDEVGSPIKYRYETPLGQMLLSPTTLRYLKVASDINGLFGSSFEYVSEIGGGYGGQALVNDQLLRVKRVEIFDLPIVNNLITKYLNIPVLNGSFSVSTLNQAVEKSYDLVISNYAFSELPIELQTQYLKKVIAKSKCGYLTMNTGLNANKNQNGRITPEQFRTLIPSSEIFEETPPTNGDKNWLIVWGHQTQFASKFFSIKKF